jgi:hypothetical protein
MLCGVAWRHPPKGGPRLGRATLSVCQLTRALGNAWHIAIRDHSGGVLLPDHSKTARGHKGSRRYDLAQGPCTTALVVPDAKAGYTYGVLQMWPKYASNCNVRSVRACGDARLSPKPRPHCYHDGEELFCHCACSCCCCSVCQGSVCIHGSWCGVVSVLCCHLPLALSLALPLVSFAHPSL